MMRHFLRSTLLISFLFVGITACKKDMKADIDNAIKPVDITTENGYLKFGSSEQFVKTLDEIAAGKIAPADLERSYGFESANTFFTKVNNEFADLTDKEQFQRFLKKYEKQIEFTTDSSLKMINGAMIFNNLLNKDGMVKIGNRLVKYGQSHIYESETATANDLLQINESENARMASGITVLNFNKGKRGNDMARTTTAPYEAYRASNMNSSSNRKFWVELFEAFYANPYYGTISDQILGNKDGYLCFYKLVVIFTSQKKVVFGWANYDANYSFIEMKYNVELPVQPVASINQAPLLPAYHFPFENSTYNYSGADKGIGSAPKLEWSLGRWEALSQYTYYRIFVDKDAFSQNRVAVPVADFNTTFSCKAKNSAFSNYIQITYSN